MSEKALSKDHAARTQLLYHFCRIQLPGIHLDRPHFDAHLQRTFAIYEEKAGPGLSWTSYLDGLYPLDWFLAVACLQGDGPAWDYLFAARAGRLDCLLVDALRARAVRLYPRNEERQESAVTEFWSHLLVPDTPGTPPILARYDGQRPLVPWLIRVFQNWHVSLLRQRAGLQPLPEEDLAQALPADVDGRWHEAFRLAARKCLGQLTDHQLLILGLRLRYRMSQREVARLLGVHEGTVSRQTSELRERCLDCIQERLVGDGWTGDDLSYLVLKEMESLLLDEPRLAADRLAQLLAARGTRLRGGEFSAGKWRAAAHSPINSVSAACILIYCPAPGGSGWKA
jgi:RNA polymerase sigma factor (sigma-70 family)